VRWFRRAIGFLRPHVPSHAIRLHPLTEFLRPSMHSLPATCANPSTQPINLHFGVPYGAIALTANGDTCTSKMIVLAFAFPSWIRSSRFYGSTPLSRRVFKTIRVICFDILSTFQRYNDIGFPFIPSQDLDALVSRTIEGKLCSACKCGFNLTPCETLFICIKRTARYARL